MKMNSYQGAFLIQLAVLFYIVINHRSSAVEFEPPSVYSSATHDGVYKFESVHPDGKSAYTQVSAAIPVAEAEKTVGEYLEHGKFNVAGIAQNIIKSDLTTQARKMSENDPNHITEVPETLVSFNDHIGVWDKESRNILWNKAKDTGALLKPVLGAKHTNLLQEFQQADGFNEGGTKKEVMMEKFGAIHGQSAGFTHAFAKALKFLCHLLHVC